ncbi:MAG: protein-disulfide reductase DsbD domain-containing protein, partial [Pseudohongiellaceae bacterium]
MPKLCSAICSLMLSCTVLHAVFAQPVDGEHVDAQLIAETTTAVPGEILWTALRLDHIQNWHTYWINPGDAGKPTEITWQLPAGVTAGAIVWPTPERFELPAELVDFGYTGEVFLLVPLSVPADFSAASLTVSADVVWLECEEICIPSGAKLNLTVPVDAQSLAVLDSSWQYGFAQTRASQPRADITLDASFSIAAGAIEVLVQATENIFEGASAVTFIPDEHRIFDYNAEQQITSQLSSLQLKQNFHRRVEREPPQRVGGLLLVTDASGKQLAYQIAAQSAGVDVLQLGGVLAATAGADSEIKNSAMPIATVFLFALLGGVILNLMPCVFPILSLKVLSLAARGDTSLREQRLHGLAYAAGVILAFLSLAVVLLTLQASGAAIG